ncbi:hypothetical protein IAT40_007968 [Kwoniella sp. CBS 6097]
MSFLPHTGGIIYNPLSSVAPPTAQTSGFAQAGDAPPSEQVGTTTGGGGGGLATSSLVPKPGTTIDPATGKPHTAGLTRPELEAKRAAEAAATAGNQGGLVGDSQGGLQSSPLVPKPGTSIDPATGQPHTAGLTRAELQAKRAAEAAGAAAFSSSSSGGQPASSAEIPPNQPGTSGISNEELEQIKNKGADLLDPTPLAQQARRSSHSQSKSGFAPDGRRLSDLTGREQAARQLAGTAVPPTAGEITPGLELPGAWGPAKTVPFPGTAPNAPTSIYEDVAEGLGKVGQAAFAVIPSPIKEAFSTQPTSPTQGTSPKAPSSPRFNVAASPPIGTNPPEARRTSGEARRSSVTALFDQAKLSATKVASDVTGTLQNTQRRASASLGTSLGKDSEIFKNVKGFMNDAFNNPVPAQSTGIGMGFYPTGPGRAHPIGIAPRFSLPSEEPAGALPGEHTSGVGALPGTVAETGVAVLPDEKKPAATLPSQENQGVRPGESSGGVGSLPGKLGESDVALLPDERASKAYNELPPATSSTGSAGPSGSALASDVIPTTGTATSRHVGNSSFAPSSSSDAVPSRSGGSSSYTGLAAPLPATFLGQGADKGATDVPATLGTASSSTTRDESAIPSIIGTAPSTAGGSAASSTFSPDSLVPETRHGNERTTSSASVTAIRHGHEGTVSQSSPLAGEGVTVPEHEELHASSPTTAVGQRSTTSGTGPSHTTSLTPGSEHEGIGHPSTRSTEGATREPGSYPAADHSASDSVPTDAAATTTAATAAGVAGTTAPTTTATTQPEKLEAEKSKAEELVDAPAQKRDVTEVAPAHAPATVDKSSSATTPSTASTPNDNDNRKAVNAEPPANGPTQIPADKAPTPTTPATPASPAAKTPTSTSATPATVTPSSPKVTTNGTNGGNGPLSSKTAEGHSRKSSTGSEKRKSGIFGKIKEKLKHKE